MSCSFHHVGMLSVVVLATIFLGLVGVLTLSDLCRRRRRRTHDPHTNLARVTAWLGERGRDLPSVAMVMGVLNRVAKRELQSEVRPAGRLCQLQSLRVFDRGRLPSLSLSPVPSSLPYSPPHTCTHWYTFLSPLPSCHIVWQCAPLDICAIVWLCCC